MRRKTKLGLCDTHALFTIVCPRARKKDYIKMEV